MNSQTLMVLALLSALFIAMLLVLRLGYRLGPRRVETEHERVGLVSIETAIFGLLGLVLAFTYSAACWRATGSRAAGRSLATCT